MEKLCEEAVIQPGSFVRCLNLIPLYMRGRGGPAWGDYLENNPTALNSITVSESILVKVSLKPFVGKCPPLAKELSNFHVVK